MTNPETTNPEAEGMFERVFHRLRILRNYKRDLLEVLDDLEPAWCVISKIQHQFTITKSEHNLLKKFIENMGLSTDISSVYGGVLPSLDKEKNLTDLNNFTQLALNYPFIVDADEVREDISSQLWEWIAEIRKDWKRWLIEKCKVDGQQDTIRILFNPTYSQNWVLAFSKEEYDKYGLIEVKHYNNNQYNIMFLHNPGEMKSLEDIWRYTMLQNFDRDNIGFSYKWKWIFKLLHKDISSEWIKIYEVWVSFKSAWDDIVKWFNSFNTFEAVMWDIWKVTFKKSYDDSWKLRWIYAFKKKRFSWEEQVRARDKEY